MVPENVRVGGEKRRSSGCMKDHKREKSEFVNMTGGGANAHSKQADP